MIQIGQDAQGRWAYMLRDEADQLVASEHPFDTFAEALAAALAAVAEHYGVPAAEL